MSRQQPQTSEDQRSSHRMAVRLNPGRWSAGARRRVLGALAVVALVAGWWLVALGLSADARRVARDLGGVGVFLGSPMASRDGKHLAYGQNTETGMALYLADGEGKNPHPIREMGEWQIVRDRLQLLGWSPDDRLFAYSRPVKGNKQSVVLCSSLVAETVATVPVNGWIADFAWLSPEAYAYVNHTQSVHVVRREQGRWVDATGFDAVSPSSLKGFTALSPVQVAWHDKRAIWGLDCITGARRTLWQTSTHALVGFSQAKGRLLIGVTNEVGAFRLRQLHLETGIESGLYETTGRRFCGVQHMDSGRGYALLCDDPEGRSLLLSPGGFAPEVALFERGQVTEFTAAGGSLYIHGSTNDEPPAIWEYQVRTGTLRCLLSGLNTPLDFSRRMVHEVGSATNGEQMLQYHLWRPYGASKRKPCPVVIGQTRAGWTPYPHVAAYNGFFFVLIHRPTWYTGLEDWKADILALRETLMKDERIDTRRIYLYARSGETSQLCDLLAEKPNWFHGAILFSPGMLPDPQRSGLRSLFMDAGEQDPGMPERLRSYQARAAASGLSVTLLLHETARHKSWSRATQQTRMEQLALYLRQQ